MIANFCQGNFYRGMQIKPLGPLPYTDTLLYLALTYHLSLVQVLPVLIQNYTYYVATKYFN